jgi:CheY-like chemotaxis protein
LNENETMYREAPETSWIRSTIDVLIVEDEPVSRKALALLVNARGYRADAVASAEEALERSAKLGVPKVALVDLDLPGMSGIELIERLESLDPTIFPVLITAAPSHMVEQIRQRYPVAYLQKPLDFERLMVLIAEHRVLH